MTSTPEKITVVIADDNDWVRFALKTALENGLITCVGEAKNTSQAIRLCDELHPDALVLDMLMPEGDGWASIPDILDASPETKVIAISAFADSTMVKKALKNGAVSFVSKSGTVEEIRKAITFHAGD